MNLADYQEHMRFRASIEPEVWLMLVGGFWRSDQANLRSNASFLD